MNTNTYKKGVLAVGIVLLLNISVSLVLFNYWGGQHIVSKTERCVEGCIRCPDGCSAIINYGWPLVYKEESIGSLGVRSSLLTEGLLADIGVHFLIALPFSIILYIIYNSLRKSPLFESNKRKK